MWRELRRFGWDVKRKDGGERLGQHCFCRVVNTQSHTHWHLCWNRAQQLFAPVLGSALSSPQKATSSDTAQACPSDGNPSAPFGGDVLANTPLNSPCNLCCVSPGSASPEMQASTQSLGTADAGCKNDLTAFSLCAAQASNSNEHR